VRPRPAEAGAYGPYPGVGRRPICDFGFRDWKSGTCPTSNFPFLRVIDERFNQVIGLRTTKSCDVVITGKRVTQRPARPIAPSHDVVKCTQSGDIVKYSGTSVERTFASCGPRRIRKSQQ